MCFLWPIHIHPCKLSFNPPKRAETWSLAGFEISVYPLSLHNSFRYRYRFRDRYRPVPDCLAIFASLASLRESIPHPFRVLCAFARAYSSSLFASSASLRESTPNPYLCVLSAFARVHSQSLSLRSQRLCESPLLTLIFAPSAPLRESIPHPFRVLCAFARAYSSSLFASSASLREPIPHPYLCVLCASASKRTGLSV